jgi:hypothetical protein
MRAILVFCCLLPCLAWAQPSPSPTPLDERQQSLKAALKEDEEHEPVPSGKDQTKPAVYNIMLANAQRERAGIGIPVIARKSVMPWIFSLLLLPVYVHIARRRGFRIR